MAKSGSHAALRDVAERALAAVGADRATIFAVDRERNEIVSRVALGLDIEIRLPITRGIVGFVARTGRTIRLRDANNDPRFDRSIDERTGYRTRSVLCVPITGRDGEVIGAIEAINKADGSFTDTDEAQLLALCADVAPLLRD
jgi:GAF domain-containing protein